MKKYICKIDGAEFSNKEALLEYISDKYVDSVNTEILSNGLSCEAIYKSFRETFPEDWKLYMDIQVRSDADNGGFFVDITSSICDFTCQIGEGGDNYYFHRFQTAAEATQHYNSFFSKGDKIINRVKETYGIDLKIIQLWESPGEGEAEIRFSFYFNGETLTSVYNFESIDAFVRKFEQYSVNCLEGKLEVIRKEYETIYLIDGVPIDGFAKRSKKVRLEIIEDR